MAGEECAQREGQWTDCNSSECFLSDQSGRETWDKKMAHDKQRERERQRTKKKTRVLLRSFNSVIGMNVSHVTGRRSLGSQYEGTLTSSH